jgi:MoxR-like ATPase
MILGAKARAILRGRHHVATEDVRAIAPAILRHRVITNFAAQAEGYSADRIIADLLEQTPPHAGGLMDDDRIKDVIKT